MRATWKVSLDEIPPDFESILNQDNALSFRVDYA